MAATVEVDDRGDGTVVVTVREGATQTRHVVTVGADDAARLAGNPPDVAALVRASFAFLLEREPKESILARFDLSVIARYFPEYEREIGRSLGRR